MRVPLVYQPCCPAPNCLGRQGELSENSVPNLTVRFILSRSKLEMLLLHVTFEEIESTLYRAPQKGGAQVV